MRSMICILHSFVSDLKTLEAFGAVCCHFLPCFKRGSSSLAWLGPFFRGKEGNEVNLRDPLLALRATTVFPEWVYGSPFSPSVILPL